MSWKDCITTALETGKITAAKASKAHAAFDKAYDEAIAAGEPEGTAVATAAERAVEQLTTLNKTKRWARINEMQRAHELHTRIYNAKDVPEELDNILRDLDNTHDSASGILMANLDRLMLKYKPKAGGFYHPISELDDIVRAGYGETTSPNAREFYDALFEAEETARKWANSLGAAIPENPNRRMPQMIVERSVASVTPDTFVSDFRHALDWDIVRYAGKTIDVNDQEKVLRDIYDAIVTEGNLREGTAQHRTGGLLARLNRERFFYYKTADDWLRLQEKYGSGNIYEQVINSVDMSGRYISMLQVLGPNPDVAKEFVKRTALKRASELDLAKPANKQRNLDKAKRAANVFEEGYKIHAMHVPGLEGNIPMQSFTAARQTAVNALLGGVFIPSVFGDLANMKAARVFAGLPMSNVLRDYLSNWVPTKANIKAFVSDGIIFQNAVQLVHQKQRYFGPLEGPNLVRRIGDITYRSTMAAHHTQVARVASGQKMLNVFAQYRNTDFDDLPIAAYLTELGVKKEDWDKFRVTPVYERDGGEFLRPIDLFNAGDMKTAVKFANVMQDFSRLSVPSPSLRSRVASGESIDPNSARGQLMRNTVSLLSFPIAIHFNQLRRIANAPGIRNKTVLAANYFLWTMGAGMAITQTKALLLHGQNFYSMDPTDESFWMDFIPRSLINGGSFGILGDVIMNNVGMANGRHSAGNPTTKYFKKALELVKPGNDTKDALRFLDANVPDLWYARLILDRTIMDEAMKQADPAGWQRYEKYMREHEAGTWWGPDEEATAPNLETVMGDE